MYIELLLELGLIKNSVIIAIAIAISITIVITIAITTPVLMHTTQTPHDLPNDQATTVPLGRSGYVRRCPYVWSGVCVDTRVIGWDDVIWTGLGQGQGQGQSRGQSQGQG